jgi:hypothetical protein
MVLTGREPQARSSWSITLADEVGRTKAQVNGADMPGDSQDILSPMIEPRPAGGVASRPLDHGQ